MNIENPNQECTLCRESLKFRLQKEILLIGVEKMTLEEAKQEIPTIDSFAGELCAYCHNDWYCSFWCETLRKAEKMFDRVQQAYARHDGDILKVDRYIKGAKI